MLELPTDWPQGPRLSFVPPTAAPTEKLDSPGTVDQVPGGGNPNQQLIPIFPVTGGYRLLGTINNTELALLLDTGAAVTLLWHIWEKIAASHSNLQPWPKAVLVSAGGVPLTIYGCTRVDLRLGGSPWFKVQFYHFLFKRDVRCPFCI